MSTIYHPTIPLNIDIPHGLNPGKLIRIQGFTPHNAKRFVLKLTCSSPGDVALYLSVDFEQECIARSAIKNLQMVYEDRSGFMPIQPGQSFQLLILCDHENFKIAFNGQHFTDFNHKLPYSTVHTLEINGQVNIYIINVDMNKSNASQNIGLVVPPNSNYGPPPGLTMPSYPSGGPIGAMSYPANPPGYSVYPPNNPSFPPQTGFNNLPFPQPPAGHLGGYQNTQPTHGMYPQQPAPDYTGGFPNSQPAPGYTGGFPNSQPAPGMYPQQPNSGHTGGYPPFHPSQGGYPHSPKSHYSSGFLDKAGMAVAGVLGTSALLGGRKNHLGVLGEKLGAAMATATAFTDRLNPKKALKKQMKAQKKALKLGLPLAGAGIGAYALSKGIRGFRRSSSSSSSSSD